MKDVYNATPPTLMLIDDDQQEADTIGHFLADIGYEVQYIDNTSTALQQIKTKKPDMIIVKAEIARSDGCCLCTELKLLPNTQHIPVVMYSKTYDEDMVDRAFQLGVDDYLTQPTLHWSMLRNRIDQILKLHHSEHEHRFLTKIFETTNDGIIITDADKNILYVNNGFTRVTGLTEDEVIGRNPRVLQSGRQDKDFYKAMWDQINSVGQWEGEVWNRKKSGEVFAEWLNISEIRDTGGRITNYVGIFSDITAVEKKHEHLSHLAYHDFLTSLPNKLLLEERLEQAVLSADRAATKLAIMFIDIDRFKPVNDKLGHHIGDKLLIEIAARLQNCVRKSDTLARVGGDEFMVFLPHLVEKESCQLVANNILKNISRPFDIEGININVNCSIGISLFPEDSKDMETLIMHADKAMYEAKNKGGIGYAFYSSEEKGA